VFDATGVTDDLVNDPAAFGYILAAVDEWAASATAKPVPLPPASPTSSDTSSTTTTTATATATTPNTASQRRQTSAPLRAGSRADLLRASDPSATRQRGSSSGAVVIAPASRSLDTPEPSGLLLNSSASSVTPSSEASSPRRSISSSAADSTPVRAVCLFVCLFVVVVVVVLCCFLMISL
jgi:cobalamin biosynthesis Mg chelatase CobN